MSKENKERKTRRLRILLMDDNTHKQIWLLRGKQSRLIYSFITALIIVFLGFFLLISYTPLKTFIPGYPDAQQRRVAASNAMTIDSLETVVARWEFYSENLRRVLSGDKTIDIDSLLLRSSANTQSAGIEDLASRDSLVRAQASEAEQFSLRSEQRRLPLEGMHFFPPIKGIISQAFESVTHPYAEVSAPANSVITAVADGTIMIASWSDENKYSIIIQHDNDLVSILKGAGKVMVGPGNKVKAGAPIGMMQSASADSGTQTLRVELWYKGEAVDPAAYIKF